MTACNICNNIEGNKSYFIKEMMFGTKDLFEYIECNHCGCLQIKEKPKNLSSYYSETYYSFSNNLNFLNRFYLISTGKYLLFNGSILGRFVSKTHGYRNYFDWFDGINFNCETSILDVGCGNGEFLHVLSYLGFRNLLGLDVNIKPDDNVDKKIKISNQSLFDLSGTYDIIILSHSFEHMNNQDSVLSKLYDILSSDGVIILRQPIKSSWAWEKYKTNWAQIDAPRHFYIHTSKSFDYLVGKTSLEIFKLKYDSNELQFIASEQYLRGISLVADESYYKNPSKSIFPRKEIKKYKDKAKLLNEIELGDQAIFYLRKKL